MRRMKYAMIAVVAFALLAGGWVAVTGESGTHKLGRLQGESIYEHYYRFGNTTMA